MLQVRRRRGQDPLALTRRPTSDPELCQLELQGGRAYYTREGSGRAVVALHGYPGSVRDFRYFAPHLAEGIELVRVALPGFGPLAQPMEDHRPEARAAHVVELVEALDLKAAVILGHSMGGVIATEAVTRRPDLFSALALVSSPGLTLHRGLRVFPAPALSRLLDGERRAALAAPLTRRAFRAMGFRGRYEDVELYNTIHGAARLDIHRHARNLRRLSLPMLVAWCEDDPIVEDAIAAALHVELGATAACFDRGGHNPMYAQAAPLADALAAFLSSP